MWDVIVAGGGPAGAVAATILARSGLRVLIVDRARFPRDKLCGDSFNPGALSVLRRLKLAGWIESHGVPVEGMLLTGPLGLRCEGRYPRSMRGRTAMRRDVDYWLLGEAVRAGAEFEDGVSACRTIVDHNSKLSPSGRVTGVVLRLKPGAEISVRARVVIAADGRRSPLASGLGLIAPSVEPRRWAIGAYFADVADRLPLGEMHIRTREYLGVAPLPSGLTNVCLVSPVENLKGMNDPERILRAAIDRDECLRDRFAHARIVAPPVVLGPLGMIARGAGSPGLLLAGDAAGFIDPVTGDGLRFAFRGAELAAETALEMLASGNPCGHLALAARRQRAFGWKWRFNRALRHIIDSPFATRTVERMASAAPALVQSLVAVAGDCAAYA